MASDSTTENLAPKSKLEGSRLHSIIANTLLLTISSGFCLLMIEVAYRLVFSNLKNKEWNDRPSSYFAPQNAITFQDFPHNPIKPKGVYRIAVIGDSFSFGPYIQFDDTFSKRLERWLNLNSKQQRVEVINYGVPSYSSSHEIDVAKRAISENADLILLQITLNDPEIKLYKPTGLNRNLMTGEIQLQGFIFRHWHSLAYVAQRILNTKAHREYQDYYYNLFKKKDSWGQFKDSIQKIGNIALTSKTPLVAAVFPLFGYEVDDAYPFYPLHKKTLGLLESINVQAIDISSGYKNIPLDRLQVIISKDRHPNEIGHRIAAEALIDWFAKAKIVPEEILPKKSYPERIAIKFEDNNQKQLDL